MTPGSTALLKYVLVWTLIRVGGRLPARMLFALADAAGNLAWLVSPRLRAITRDHMAHIPAYASDPRAARRAARRCVVAAARYWADLARAAYLDPDDALAETERFEGVEHVFDARARGCGVVMVTAHVGAPEFVANASAHLGLDIMALTEELQPPRLNALVQSARRRSGTHFVPADLGGVRDAIEHLRKGGLIAIVSDRDIQGAGMPVPFFGARAPLPTGAIEIALRTGAPVVPGFVFRTGLARNRLCFLPPLEFPRTGNKKRDIEAGMVALARALETGITMAPDQWFVLHPVWPRTAGVPSHARPKAGESSDTGAR